MKTVLVTSRSFSSGKVDVGERLRLAGVTLIRRSPSHDLAELRDCLPHVDGWIAGTGPITGEHFDLAPNLRVVARYGVGVDSVDLQAAHIRNIIVTNTPGANTQAVADHTLALLLSALRGVVAGDRRVRRGDWRVDQAREISTLRIGIVGVGRIGQAVAERLIGFGAVIYGLDPRLDQRQFESMGILQGTDKIPGDVDVVTIHAPGNECLIDGDWISKCFPGLILINTARASLVDESAIAGAIRSGRLGFYAADTIENENISRESVLLSDDISDRVIVTPHCAAQTIEAVDRMGSMAADSLLEVFSKRVPQHALIIGGTNGN